MRDTSAIAYQSIQQSGAAYTQQRAIFDFLEATGAHMTRREIAEATGYSINAVCGRIFTLVQENKLEELPRRQCNVTGSQAHPVGISTNA